METLELVRAFSGKLTGLKVEKILFLPAVIL